MSKVLPQLHLDNQLCFSLYSLSRLVTQAYQPLLKNLGLTYPQYLVLLVLWQAMEEKQLPVPVGFLCERLLLDTGTVTPLLKRMESAGLVERSRSATDERVVLVGLSAQAVQLRHRAASVPASILCSSHVSVDEAVALREEVQGFIQRWQDPAS